MDTDENGYKGACYACEPVGELNVRLAAEIAELKAEIEELHLHPNLDKSIVQFKANAIKEMLSSMLPKFAGIQSKLVVKDMYHYADNLEQGE